MRAGTRSCACLALVRAFCPGEAASLRECRAKDWSSFAPCGPPGQANRGGLTGERIEIEYDLPDESSRKRAFELVAIARDASAEFLVAGPAPPTVSGVPVRGWCFADISAQIRGDRLHVHAQAIRD